MLEIKKGTSSDIPAAIEFLKRMHASVKQSWFQVMADGTHPTTDITDFVIAADSSGNIAALVICQPYHYVYDGCVYKGIRLEEFFCTREHNNRETVGKILDKIKIHAEEIGAFTEHAHGQDALYGKYDFFGYTFGLPVEMDGYTFMIQDEEAGNDFVIEEASDDDIPKMAELYKQTYKRNLMATVIDYNEISYIKNIYGNLGLYNCKFFVIKSSTGTVCGFFLTQTSDKYMFMLELDNSCSFHQIRPFLMAHYKNYGLNRMPLFLGKTHPAYMVFKGFFQQESFTESGYIKIYNIPKFLMKISGVLSKRLAHSPYAFLTRTFTMAMHNHDDVLRFEFVQGKLVDVSHADCHTGEVNIERDRFIRLLFGRVSPQEMEDENYLYAFADNDCRNIFEILFPKMQSHLISIN